MAARLDPVDPPDVVDDAGLVVREIIANAVRPGCQRVHVALSLHHGELKIEVTDSDAGLMSCRDGTGNVHGRGLVLVDALAAAWGLGRTDGGGRQIWATLLIPRELTSSLPCENSSALAR